ncbi:MAG TPA: hypothetical protein VJ974_00530 [Geopsychrobacteraceae bacterium]|nr:hypothetical protein [Geopsychrobacteraceae bacterium]
MGIQASTFGAFAKAGKFAWEVTVSADGFGSASDDGTDLTIAFGGQANFL